MRPRWEQYFEIEHRVILESPEDLSGFDGLLIDLSLDLGVRGEDLFENIVKSIFSGPTFVLSNDEKIHTKLKLLKLGITDYLWKSMPEEEILLRITNALYRAPKSPSPQLQLDQLKLDPVKMQVVLNGIMVDLSRIEYRLLLVLMSRFPEPTEMKMLHQDVWSQNHVEDGTINTFVWKLNKKLEGWSKRIRRNRDELSIVDRQVD